MKIRRYAALALAAVMTACLLGGCSGNKNTSEETLQVEAVLDGADKEDASQTDASGADANADGTETEANTEAVTIAEVTSVPDDFLLGCDVSTLIVQENSGVVYHDADGNEEDLLKILADNSVNLVRIRVWNDPYDADGNGYGGGNCDVDNAIAIGKRATQYGMGVLINFHYSDFWADPSKQMCPKAWEGMDIDEKTEALYQYTLESLEKILDAGVNVTMVQIGNETTTGMAGESAWGNVTKLMSAGSKAVRELAEKYDKDIQVAIQFTNPEKGQYDTYAKTLQNNNVDYDIFASSYYPYWHGTLENLTSELKNVADNYGKKVMVVEISYPYTYEDGDGASNNIYEGAWGTFDYEISEQGQIDAVTDCAKAVAQVGDAGIGICYWEPAWIPVPVEDGQDRSEIWEKYGSGWASSYAGEYDPNDAGQYYGGSGWDNQALFDYNGYPLKSLDMFNQIRNMGK